MTCKQPLNFCCCLCRIAICPLPTLLVLWRIHCLVSTRVNFVHLRVWTLCTRDCDVTWQVLILCCSVMVQKMQRLPRIPRRRCRYVACQGDSGLFVIKKWHVADIGSCLFVVILFVVVLFVCLFVVIHRNAFRNLFHSLPRKQATSAYKKSARQSMAMICCGPWVRLASINMWR